MKTAWLPLLTLLLLAPRPAVAALDFTLQHKMMAADGYSLDKPYITDGDSKIFLQIPLNWKTSGGGATLDFIPDTADASIRMSVYQGAKLLTIDQAGGQDLSGQITAQLPPDAKNPKIVSVDLNPMNIFGWSTLEVTLRYDYFGETMRRGLMYLNMLPGRVLQLSVVATDADFDKVHKQARQVLSSWFEPSRDLPPDLQRKYGEGPAVGD